MEETAIDMNESGFDFSTGYGFVSAFAAVEAINDGPIKWKKRTKNSNKSKRPENKSDHKLCPVENFLEPIEEYCVDQFYN
jgi:hypothetical protein